MPILLVILVLISEFTMEVQIRKEVDSPITQSGDSSRLEDQEQRSKGHEINAGFSTAAGFPFPLLN